MLPDSKLLILTGKIYKTK